MIHKKIHLSGLHCVSCSLLIEGELADIGIDATCDYKKQIVDIAFDEKKHTEKEAITVITKLGYTVKNEYE